MGRIMRPFEGKKFGVWLDHSGNYLRFRNDWDKLFSEGVTDLDDSEEKTKKELTEKEKAAAKCPACGSLWIWFGNACGNCGHEKRLKQVVTVAGELHELGMTSRQALAEN
jgi:predicted RNA-binding Zn-ribbon protein involved in translation (DUF1610 family)